VTSERRFRVVKGKKTDPDVPETPPSDDLAEKGILGCLLGRKELYDQAISLQLLAKHFYRIRNQLVFSALMALHADGVFSDLILLEERLRQTRALDDVGGMSYLHELFEVVPTPTNFESYVRAVKKLYHQRCRLVSLDEAQRAIKDGQFERAAELARLAARPIDEFEASDNPLTTPISPAYCIFNGCYAKREFSKINPAEELSPTPITNFTIQVVAEEWADDGTGALERRVRMKGRLADGTALEEKVIPAKDWSQINVWLHANWGHRPVMHVNPDPVRRCIAISNQDAPVRRHFQHTGWAKAPDGSPVFLLADGPVAGTKEGMEALRATCDVSVDRGHFGKYSLPTEWTDAELRESYVWLERFLECADKRATAPLLAMHFLAPLASILDPTLALWLSGRSGLHKTSLTVASMGLWGTGWHEHRMPTSWVSTPKSMLEVGFQGKDLPVIFDNWVPDAKGEMQRAVTEVAYSIGDGTHRSRLTDQGKLKAAKPVRGLIISTGEDAPQGEGRINRFYGVRFYDTTCNRTLMAEVQQAAWAGKLAPAMSHYLNWLVTRIQDPTWIAKVKARYEAYTVAGRGEGAVHMRLPAQSAWIQIGLDLCLSAHPNKRWQSDSMKEDISHALRAATVERNRSSEEARLSYRFVSAIHYLIQTGHLVGRRPDGLQPAHHAHVFGWRDMDANAGETISQQQYDMGLPAVVPRHRNAIDGVWIEQGKGPRGLETDDWYVSIQASIVYTMCKEVIRNGLVMPESLAALRGALISDKLMEDGHWRLGGGSSGQHVWRIDGPAYLKIIGVVDAPTPEAASPVVRVAS
jgi:hypothetical protein